MENLISDCFPPIFSYLSLADLFHLRTVSRRFKQEVEAYFPTHRSLPLYLTTPRTPEEIAKYEIMCILSRDSLMERNKITKHEGFKYNNRLSETYIRKLRFGSSGSENYEDGTILKNQNHFRPSEFLVLNHSSALFKFLSFIKKHCPKIEKLALVIDHCAHYLPEVSKVLEAFPDIKVLLLESTLQDSFRYKDYYSSFEFETLEWLILEENFLNFSPQLYDSILKLKSLEELYLFPKQNNSFWIKDGVERPGQDFVETLINRLRVLHMNTRIWSHFPADGEWKETIEELACPTDMWLKRDSERLMFPKLKKFILLHACWNKINDYDHFFRPFLKVFDISNDYHRISPISTRNLNYFTGLESFHCGSIIVGGQQEDEKVENYDSEIVAGDLMNWTIKHLQIVFGPNTEEERKRYVRRWNRYFVALETCTFLESKYSVIRVSDLRK